jgi:hypothetical protein
MGRAPKFCGLEQETTCAGNASLDGELFGPPRISAGKLSDWIVDWVLRGGESLAKPTHFEARDGRY